MCSRRTERFRDTLECETAHEDDLTPSLNSPKRIKGVCTKIEKSYFRLTGLPIAAKIRPIAVLKKSLENVKDKYLGDGDYQYACDQLKSIRYLPSLTIHWQLLTYNLLL